MTLFWKSEADLKKYTDKRGSSDSQKQAQIHKTSKQQFMYVNFTI